jgi:hypothetical protein
MKLMNIFYQIGKIWFNPRSSPVSRVIDSIFLILKFSFCSVHCIAHFLDTPQEIKIGNRYWPNFFLHVFRKFRSHSKYKVGEGVQPWPWPWNPRIFQMVMVRMTILIMTIIPFLSSNDHGQMVKINRYFNNFNRF